MTKDEALRMAIKQCKRYARSKIIEDCIRLIIRLPKISWGIK